MLEDNKMLYTRRLSLPRKQIKKTTRRNCKAKERGKKATNKNNETAKTTSRRYEMNETKISH